jgi:gliding motility-associated-like protein
MVNFIPAPVFNLGADNTLCEGSTIVLDVTSTDALYTWNTGSTSPTLLPVESGNYKVRVFLSNQCIVEDSINVQFISTPTVELGKELNLCRGSSIAVIPMITSGKSYLWSDGISTAERMISVPGTFTLQVTNQCGYVTDVMLVKDGGICNLSFPNAFTPNQDGKNDVFKCNRIFGIQNYFLQVYNRWGQLVFTSHEPANGWNGMINGHQAQVGNYIWRAGYERSDTGLMKYQQGTVLILR